MKRSLCAVLCLANALVAGAAGLDLRLQPDVAASGAASSLPSRAGVASPIARTRAAGLCQDTAGACLTKAAALIYGSLHDNRFSPQQAVCRGPNPPNYCAPPVR